MVYTHRKYDDWHILVKRKVIMVVNAIRRIGNDKEAGLPYRFFQEWSLDIYKSLHLGAADRGLCVAKSEMLFTGINFEEAAQRIIAAKAEVGCTINVNIVLISFCHKNVKIQL